MSFFLAVISTVVSLGLMVLVYGRIARSPEWVARWNRDNRLRSWLRLLFVAVPSLAVMAWILPNLVKKRVPPPSYAAESQVADEGESGGPQRQLERRLAGQVTAVLNELLGAGHFRTILRADADAGGNLQRLSMDLVIDSGTYSYDAAVGRYEIGTRSSGDIEAGFAAAKKAVGFDPNRGDEASLTTLKFDHTRMIQSEMAYRGKEKEWIWTHRAIMAAKILGVVGIIFTLNFIAKAVESAMGLRGKEESSAGSEVN